MSSPARKQARASGISRYGGLLCCVLCFTASCDASVVSQVLERNIYVCSGEASASELVDTPDDDDDMIRTGSSVDRRGERKHTGSGTSLAPTLATPAYGNFGRFGLSLFPTHRSGSEHTHRNGFGAPLLC